MIGRSLLLAIAMGGAALPLADSINDDQHLMFASMGAGWRAIPFIFGYYNIFAQAGLINATWTRFNAMGFSSSSAWFASQFFYSQIFFDNITKSTPDEIRYVTVQWFESYDKVFNPVNDLFSRGFDSYVFELAHNPEASVAHVLGSMLEITALDFGDPDFQDVIANFDNRVPALSNTDFYSQTSFVPNSRVLNAFGWKDSLTYMGPKDSDMIIA
jgi:hypothetical protein